jgi:hypothetical protein
MSVVEVLVSLKSSSPERKSCFQRPLASVKPSPYLPYDFLCVSREYLVKPPASLPCLSKVNARTVGPGSC